MSGAASRRVAFITGASRGIGKACAVWLARAGFDVALSARTRQPGEAREHSATVAVSNTTPLPGSLAETAAIAQATGVEAFVASADLTDITSVRQAMLDAVEHFGRVDVLVNNGRYIGPGLLDRILDTPIELIGIQIEANIVAPVVLIQTALPIMLEAGGGTIVDITSAAAYADPLKPAGAGGWSLGYAVSKGGFHRIAGVVAAELADRGILCFNVQPGSIATERYAADMGTTFGFDPSAGEPPDVVGAVVSWLATSPDAARLNGQTIEAQDFCWKRSLLPEWRGPRAYRVAMRFDRAAEIAAEMENQLVASERGAPAHDRSK